jgi:hypothetical protein
MIPLSDLFRLKYRDDPGLAFMRFCTHQDLNDLADILMTQKGSKRWTEQLSTDPRFIENEKDLTRSWDVIAAEVQRFGRLVAQALAGPALKGGELENVSPTAEQSALGKLLANWSTVMEGKAAREDRRVGQQSLGI